MSHEAYLDEPVEAIQWMVRIDDIVTEIKAKRQRDAENAGG